jgi:hypothetical protein
MLTLADVPPLSEDKGRIYFYTLPKLWQVSLFAQVRLEGEPIGKPIPGRFFFRDVDPGTYEFTIRTEVLRKCVLSISAGETRSIRISAGIGWLTGRFRLELVAAETAQKEMYGLMLIENR